MRGALGLELLRKCTRVVLAFVMDLSNIVVWNVRGLNQKSHRDAVRIIISEYRQEIVCLQETKINRINDRVLLATLGSDFNQHVALPAQGTRGGVLIAWRGACCQAITTRVDVFSVSVLFRTSGGHQWWFTGVYGPQGDAQKVEFMQELRDVHAACIGPWAVAGDFNLIYRAADKNNQNIDRAMMGRFRRLINDLQLCEIDLLGRRYTWSNEREAPTLVRLDRVFCSNEWDAAYPNHFLHTTTIGVSDHCPLILSFRADVLEVLERLDLAQERRVLTTEESWLRRQLKQRCLALNSLHRTILRARSRLDWLADGDANSQLFHAQAKYRKKKNYIARLQEGDRILTVHEDKEQAIWNFYSTLIGTQQDRVLEAFYQGPHDLAALDAPFPSRKCGALSKKCHQTRRRAPTAS